MKHENSPGFPTTVDEARALARDIKAARAKRTPWWKIGEHLSISRIEAIRLAHSLDEVLDEMRGTSNDSTGTQAAQNGHDVVASLLSDTV
ncbi:hypothetical protein Achl_4031 (plasmid) [Pseudarthrobacter chlorophenolicus A6]|uniref:Uncharacterized protein n=1 Tax=Pseudarthrobacter chlorophenolicus (strain ATCC 700700 / DSM 12829 / CIP 107037 / JCM 12360 / KCTC 9906 / NCIMB 13794 / A6) TaxID=452863 RepID=B8HHT5_PSECP|nr:hypothetical protein Achl_4031 [Pseudarthrobacter chlorophenolicus A6]SDQ19840.1 hypothetical protein SAMN04489738_0682 [Pseudarthrobacter chlorophenolicus]